LSNVAQRKKQQTVNIAHAIYNVTINDVEILLPCLNNVTYFLNDSVKNQLILTILVRNILRKLDSEKYRCFHLTYKLLPYEVQKATFQQYSTII